MIDNNDLPGNWVWDEQDSVENTEYYWNFDENQCFCIKDEGSYYRLQSATVTVNEFNGVYPNLQSAESRLIDLIERQ